MIQSKLHAFMCCIAAIVLACYGLAVNSGSLPPMPLEDVTSILMINCSFSFLLLGFFFMQGVKEDGNQDEN